MNSFCTWLESTETQGKKKGKKYQPSGCISLEGLPQSPHGDGEVGVKAGGKQAADHAGIWGSVFQAGEATLRVLWQRRNDEEASAAGAAGTSGRKRGQRKKRGPVNMGPV